MLRLKLCILYLLLVRIHSQSDALHRKFPEILKFGASTSAYQAEGGWNVDGKSENIWDRITHTKPEFIVENANGDATCDSYNLYKRDIEIIKELGLDFYRFSISWSRILPSGFNDKINQAGIDYYKNLIDELLSNGVIPMVTLYHWDLPQNLQDLGGWTNPLIVNYFKDYTKVVFENFGDKVKEWVTFNEPDLICLGGYGRDMVAPALKMTGIAEYLCAHNLILAHASAYRLYDEMFRPHQNGIISLTLSAYWFEPADDSPENKAAANRAIEFLLGWFAHPILSKTGDYPSVMKEEIKKRSLAQGFKISRLPSFSKEEVKFVQGTYDFIGLNHYTSRLTKVPTGPSKNPQPSYDDDRNIEIFTDVNWGKSMDDWLFVVPWGFTKILNWVKETYDNPKIMILENGFSDSPGNVNDTGRIAYHKAYFHALLDAIDDGCTVTFYALWSLMDNFEWRQGYTKCFGLYNVDFSSPNKTRSPKASAKYYRSIIKNRYLDS